MVCRTGALTSTKEVQDFEGQNGRFHARSGASGTLAYDNSLFGDPAPGVRKACWRR